MRKIPPLLALALLGAHAVRGGAPVPVAVIGTVIAMALLFVDSAIASIAVQTTLWGGVASWLKVAASRASERLAEGRPWMRLVIILGAVALFTAWAALLARAPKKAPATTTPEPT